MVTFEKLLKIIQDGSKTDYQKAADLHSLLVGNYDTAPPPKPAASGKKRGRKPKDANGTVTQEAGGGIFGGEQPA